MSQYPAHIREGEGGREEQTVRAHCEAAAKYAAECLDSIGLETAAYLAGLIHDMGKLKKEYRDYLHKCVENIPVQRGSVNHTFAAVRLLLEAYHHDEANRFEDVACELLAYAAGAHHGLFDCVDEHGKDGFWHRLKKDSPDYDSVCAEFYSEIICKEAFDALAHKALDELAGKLRALQQRYGNSLNPADIPLQIGFMARLLLSSVIEGDRRDTDEFMNRTVYPRANGNELLWRTCLARTEQKLCGFSGKSTLNLVRSEISQACKDAADKPQGIYRLNLPTGAGKTLASLRYALAHAEKKKKRRIIFVIPLLTIAEQNAKIIREYIGDDTLVLEHHSNVVEPPQDTHDERNDRELLCENWGVPCVITTLVQLLDTCFSGKSTCIRRFQALCNSVIVFDEVQTVPTKMLSQFNGMLSFLSEVCGTTVILCSATQPELTCAKRPLATQPQALVQLNAEQQAVFKRTQLIDLGTRRLDEIGELAAGILLSAKSLLIVCNLKSEAKALYEALKGRGNVYHLSAAMCAEHRLAVLNAVHGKLGREQVLCIATQVIEAGVDISFEAVLRFTAGMDSVIQAAGRCNRNGESAQPAAVYLVTCAGETLQYVRDIKIGREVTLSLLDAYRRNPAEFAYDLASEQAIRHYYHDFYQATKSVQDFEVKQPIRDSLYALLSENRQLAAKCRDIPRFYMRQAFGLAGSLFEVFEDNTTQVIVPYAAGAEIIDDLCSERASHDFAFAKRAVQRAKRYTVTLYEYQRKKLDQMQAIRAAGETGATVLMPGQYDSETGLSVLPGKLDYMEV